MYVLPVRYVPDDILNEVTYFVEDAKREFQWVPHDVLCSGPLARRRRVFGVYVW